MPIYEYVCGACGHEFEEIQKFSDKPIRTCPQCKKRRVKRIVSKSTFKLKGGGWYADGYATPQSDGEVAQAHDEGTTETPQKAAAKTAEGAPKTAPDSKTSTDPGSKDTADKTKSAGSGQDGKSAPAKANKRTSKASARTHAS